MFAVGSVNIGSAKPNPHKRDVGQTGIDKQPVDGPIEVRAPGPGPDSLGSGVVGDFIGDLKNHGGDEQAVYAYAREDLDRWSAELGRELRDGSFGENLTTQGVDLNQALIGERWRIGADVVLQVSGPRVPCRTFAGWLEIQGWVKTFTAWALPGAYLRVVSPGQIRKGNPVEVVRRPDHDVTIGLTFRALTLEPELLPRLLDADDLHEEVKDRARRRLPLNLD